MDLDPNGSPHGISGDSTNFADTVEFLSKPSHARLEDVQVDEKEISRDGDTFSEKNPKIRKSCSGYYNKECSSPVQASPITRTTSGAAEFKALISERSSGTQKATTLSQLLLMQAMDSKKL